MKCPACKKRLTFSDALKLTNWYAKRIMSPCAGCATVLILYKISWRITNLIFLALLLGFLTLENNFLYCEASRVLMVGFLSFSSAFFVTYIFFGLQVKLAKL